MGETVIFAVAGFGLGTAVGMQIGARMVLRSIRASLPTAIADVLREGSTDG